MEYRILGKTGLKVSALGFGLGAIGGAYGPVEEQEGISAIHAALENGINFFDTSPFYGLTKAETILGKALKSCSFPREKYIIATKCGRYGMEEFDFSPERVTAEFEKSLQRLGLEYVDILYVHDVEYGNLDYIIENTIPALRKLQKSGKCKWIGITGYPLKIFTHVLNKIELDCILSYCHFSLNDDSLSSLFPFLQSKGVGITSAAPMSQGLLTERGPPEWHASSKELREACNRAAEYCKEKGSNISKLGLQFSYQNKEIACTMIGISSKAELERNLQVIKEPLDKEILQGVLDLLKPVHNQTWKLGKEENN